jgi:hypothetical protein
MGKLAIETRGLKKSFGKTHAVAGVDLAVSAGGVYGVLRSERGGQDHHDPHAGHASTPRRRRGASARLRRRA